jgi:hypothetical protein
MLQTKTTQETSMLKLSMKLAVAAAVVAGSATIVAAQGFDPNGANRFQRLAQAGTAGFYLGQLQGPMASTILQNMASSQVSLYSGEQINPYAGNSQAPAAQRYIGRTAYAPRGGMISSQVSGPIPGYVDPQY